MRRAATARHRRQDVIALAADLAAAGSPSTAAQLSESLFLNLILGRRVRPG